MQPRILWISSHPPGERSAVPGTSLRAEPCPPGDALERVRRTEYDAAVLEAPWSGWSPEALLGSLHSLDPTLPVLFRDRQASLNEALRLGRLGAWQYLDCGSPAEQLLRLAAAERARLRPASALPAEPWEALLVGSSREIRQVGHLIRLVGPRRSTVLISGETGTGKELAARALHLSGPRRHAPFVAINCSALPAALLEAELFGHVRGAFTGAQQSRVGRFEQAHGGTLFLDEIGDLPLELQAKLLRVLQEREIQRLGSPDTVRIDVRVISASNCDLARQVERGVFREDLFYRLAVVALPMPPLRSRPGDIYLLTAHFLAKTCEAEGLPLKTAAPDAIERLAAYSWPGNVRQLQNAVESAVALSGERHLLGAADFPLPGKPNPDSGPGSEDGPIEPVISLPDEGLDFERTLTSIERSILQQALRRTGGNKKAAADMLGLKRTTLAAKVKTLVPNRN